MVVKSGYDWKIGLKKFGIGAVYVILAGLASVYGDNEYYLMIAPMLMWIENLLKHKFGMFK